MQLKGGNFGQYDHEMADDMSPDRRHDEDDEGQYDHGEDRGPEEEQEEDPI